jgi:putative endonuclease
MSFYVYILRNLEGRHYIGQTSDLTLRLQRHNDGKVFWTKSRGPWKVVYSQAFQTRSEAITEEKRLKALKSSFELEKIIAQQ